MINKFKLVAAAVTFFSLNAFSASAHIIAGDPAHNTLSWHHAIMVIGALIILGLGAVLLFRSSRPKQREYVRQIQDREN